MKNLDRSLVFGLMSLSLYVVGGVSTFTGLAMVFIFKGRMITGLGTSDSLGYLMICVGLCLSIAGVMLMRILRNRFLI